MVWLRSPVHLAVERTPTTWTFVGVERRRDAAPRFVAAALFSGDDLSLEAEIRRFRREQKLPSDATLVFWPSAGDRGVATLDDRAGMSVTLPKARVIRERVAPFVRGGGRVREFLLPHEAIARLVALSGWPAACVLAMHACGACLAIVEGGTARGSYLTWAPAGPAKNDDDRLLVRYQLAARLAPHLVAWAREAPTARVAVCGPFSGLRSAMMPIVEELDREIEVLDAALVGRAGPDLADPDEISGRQLAWAAAAGG